MVAALQEQTYLTAEQQENTPQNHNTFDTQQLNLTKRSNILVSKLLYQGLHPKIWCQSESNR